MSASGEVEATAAGPEPVWSTGSVLMIAADRTVRSVLDRLGRATRLDWVVVVRSIGRAVHRYAYRPKELIQIASRLSAYSDATLAQALDLHESGASAVSQARRAPKRAAPGPDNPAAARVVDLDADGGVAAVGEYPAERASDADEDGAADGDGGADDPPPVEVRKFRGSKLPGRELLEGLLGSLRSISRAPVEPDTPPPPSQASPTAETTISAETRAEITVGTQARVDFRIELTAEAMPLATAQLIGARLDLPFAVLLSLDSDALQIVGPAQFVRQPPATGQPLTGNFIVKAVRTGTVRLAVSFQQGGSELGVIGLATTVLAAGAKDEAAKGSATATHREAGDDDKLALIIQQIAEGGQVRYRYILHCEALNLQYESFESKPLLDRGNGPAATQSAFVERIYARVTQELKSFDDLEELQREAQGLGALLSRELFDPDVARRLWPLRDRIKLVQIRTWEPYIPWELVRLHDPDTLDTDKRFLAEYNLIRTLTDREPERRLPMRTWRYLAASFPMKSYQPVGAELDYLTGEAPPSLAAHGVKAAPVAATRNAFYDTVADGDFDVLHVSCHAASSHGSIEDSSLVFSDEAEPGTGKARPIAVNSTTVANEAKLLKRRPLVFLNACETGRVGAVLTDWGGWPNLFLRAGAGAFVGSAWSVRDKPAAAFAEAFYEALWAGRTLAEAAGEARAAAKALGDASWLAFKVYGHPRARREDR